MNTIIGVAIVAVLAVACIVAKMAVDEARDEVRDIDEAGK